MNYNHPYIATTPQTAALFQVALEQLGYYFEMRTQMLDFGVMMDVTFNCPHGVPEDADLKFNEMLKHVQTAVDNNSDQNLADRYSSLYNHYAFGLM